VHDHVPGPLDGEDEGQLAEREGGRRDRKALSQLDREPARPHPVDVYAVAERLRMPRRRDQQLRQLLGDEGRTIQAQNVRGAASAQRDRRTDGEGGRPALSEMGQRSPGADVDVGLEHEPVTRDEPELYVALCHAAAQHLLVVEGAVLTARDDSKCRLHGEHDRARTADGTDVASDLWTTLADRRTCDRTPLACGVRSPVQSSGGG
jgi:hypothetical protein